MRAVILGAGLGSRLGKPIPKPLTPLESGETIMERQVSALTRFLTEDDVIVVVGFRKELIFDAFPRLTHVVNEAFAETNTAKSLLGALRETDRDDVIWLNGDVVFDEVVVDRIRDFDGSCMAVNKASVGDEEVKYNVSPDGSIREVSKSVNRPLGEAVGVNKIAAKDVPLLQETLEQCAAQDYFERGIELAIEKGLDIRPVDISDVFCVEVDTPDDLKEADEWLSRESRRA